MVTGRVDTFEVLRFHVAGRHSYIQIIEKAVPMKGQTRCGY